MDLDAVRLKTNSQLDDNERQFLRDNIDKLTDEDRQAYDFLTDNSTPLESEGGESTDSESGSAAGKSQTPTPPQTPSVGEAPQAYSFKSEEEAKAFVKKQLEEQQSEKQKAIDAAATPEAKKYVEENWKPDNWNVAMQKAVEFAKEEIKEETRQQEIKKNYDEFDRQWTEVSTEHNLPALDTVEGRQIHNQITHLMVGFGLTTFQEGYAKWEVLTAAEKAATENIPTPNISASEAGAALAKARSDKAAAARKAATKIGGQNAGAGAVKGSASLKPTAEDLRGKSMTKLIKEGLQSS